MGKISIITISFNQAAYLEHAIRSVISQGYDDLEYSVIDPGFDQWEPGNYPVVSEQNR